MTLISLSDLRINVSASPTALESLHQGSTERRRVGISKGLSQAVKQLSICRLGGATKRRQRAGRSLLSSSTWIRRPWRALSRTPEKLCGGVRSCRQPSHRAMCSSCEGVCSGRHTHTPQHVKDEQIPWSSSEKWAGPMMCPKCKCKCKSTFLIYKDRAEHLDYYTHTLFSKIKHHVTVHHKRAQMPRQRQVGWTSKSKL